MQRTMTISESDYTNLINNREVFIGENKKLQRQIVKLEEEVRFFKNTGDEILVIEMEDGREKFTFRTKEKEAIQKIVTINDNLYNENARITDENNKLKELVNTLRMEFAENQMKHTTEINKLNSRSFFRRIFNLPPKI